MPVCFPFYNGGYLSKKEYDSRSASYFVFESTPIENGGKTDLEVIRKISCSAHDIFNALKFKNIKNFGFFQAQTSL